MSVKSTKECLDDIHNIIRMLDDDRDEDPSDWYPKILYLIEAAEKDVRYKERLIDEMYEKVNSNE